MHKQRNKDYPAPSTQAKKSTFSEPSIEDTTKTQEVKAGEVIKDEKGKVVGKPSKQKAAYGQTKGLLWYNYIK